MDIPAQIERLRRHFEDVERQLNDPRVFGDLRRATELGREHQRLRQLFENYATFQKVERELKDNDALFQDNKADPELRQMAEQELAVLRPRHEKLFFEVQNAIVPADPNDSRNTIVEIRAGAEIGRAHV